MKLYVMTKGREGRQETLKHIPSDRVDDTILVCPPGEQHDWPNIIYEPFPMDHSKKFQWLLHRIDQSPTGKGVILDDDLHFARRDQENLSRYVKCDKVWLSDMWDQVELHLKDVAFVSVHPRMMANRSPSGFKRNGKIVCIYAVNTCLFPGRQIPKVDYDPILADVHLNLWLLSHARENRLITDFCVDWLPSQSPGGCDYRTMAMQKVATGRISELYPDHAKQVWKKAKKENWLGEGGRWDLRVQWKRLFEEAPYA
jgi:hypothetical protein